MISALDLLLGALLYAGTVQVLKRYSDNLSKLMGNYAVMKRFKSDVLILGEAHTIEDLDPCSNNIFVGSPHHFFNRGMGMP